MAVTPLHSKEPIYDPNDLIPRVESRIFEDIPGAHFWIGKVASGSVIEMPLEYQGHHKLRANVFIDQENYLPPSARSSDGGEYDEYDERAVQFAVLERINGDAGVVGTVRLIEKSTRDEKLPAELLFPEIFQNQPAEIGSVEVSRLIARHPIEATQAMISLAAIRASDLYCVDKEVPNTYSVLERPLFRRLKLAGIPCHQISDLKVLPEFGNSENMVVRINPQEMLEAARAGKGHHGVLRKFFERELENQGLGYYDETLVSPDRGSLNGG